MEDLSGQRLGRYLLTRLVGRGGMASVYEAHDPTLDRVVAVKVLAAHLVDEADFLARFQHEARAVAALRHPAIVHVYDFGNLGVVPYMVMEFIDGPSLEAVLKDVARRPASPGPPAGTGATGAAERATRGPAGATDAPVVASAAAPAGALPPDAVVRLATAVCSALDYGHARGMVHRDIKPANVLLTADLDPVISDYGIARIAGMSHYTATGMVMGTVHYMSPEQAQGLPVDGRTDLYAMAVVAFEAVTGRVPYVGDTTASVLAQHIAAPVPAATSLRPDLPPAVDAVFARALAKQVDDRYATAGEFAEALRESLGVAPAVASGPPLPAAQVDEFLSSELISSLRTRPDVTRAATAAALAAAAIPTAAPTTLEPAADVAAEGDRGRAEAGRTRLETAAPGAAAPPTGAGGFAEGGAGGGSIGDVAGGRGGGPGGTGGGATADAQPPASRGGSPLRWIVIAAAVVVIAAAAVVGLVWKPWQGGGAGGAAVSASPTATATANASASTTPTATAAPTETSTPTASPTESPSESPSESPTVEHPIAVALEDVFTTQGVLTRCPFIVKDETSKVCKVTVVLTNAAGTKKLKVYRTRSDYWWATNVKDAQNFTCSLPPGEYRWYFTAKNGDGVSSEKSNVRRFVVR